MNLRLELYRKKEKLKRYLRRRRDGSCTVLLYHRVADTGYDPQQLCVSPENFEKQLKYLKRHYHFINVEEFNHHLNTNKAFPKNALLINFDDGYADNLLNALPILEAKNLQSVFYIATANLNTNHLFWWDELDEIFRNKEAINNQVLIRLLKTYGLSNPEQLYAFLLTALKTAGSLSVRNDLLEKIRQLGTINSDLSPYRCLTYHELKQLAASRSAVIGGHTVHHLSLGHLSRADQEYEIQISLKILEEILQKPVKLFSYPYGERQNYNNDTMSICRSLGLSHGAANYGGYVSPADDLFSFTRFVVRNDNPTVLVQKLKASL